MAPAVCTRADGGEKTQGQKQAGEEPLSHRDFSGLLLNQDVNETQQAFPAPGLPAHSAEGLKVDPSQTLRLLPIRDHGSLDFLSKEEILIGPILLKVCVIEGGSQAPLHIKMTWEILENIYALISPHTNKSEPLRVQTWQWAFKPVP